MLSGASASAAGAAVGSFFLPPLGTVVGLCAGTVVGMLSNTKFKGLNNKSLVDYTKDKAKSLVNKGGKLISDVGKQLDKIFW